jgi:Txe/YoeB family toxin of Txe-Axe toxin-antitoxin module
MGMVPIEISERAKEMLEQQSQQTGLTPSQIIQQLIEDPNEGIGSFPKLENEYVELLKDKNEGKRMLTLDELKSELSRLRRS